MSCWLCGQTSTTPVLEMGFEVSADVSLGVASGWQTVVTSKRWPEFGIGSGVGLSCSPTPLLLVRPSC